MCHRLTFHPVHPDSHAQVRLQLGATGGPMGVAAGIIKNDGFGALYTVRARSLIPIRPRTLSNTPKRRVPNTGRTNARPSLT